MNAIRRLLGIETPDESSDPTDNVRSAHEIAKEDIELFDEDACGLIYCELCEQVFGSGDLFYTHRMASSDEQARKLSPENGFTHRRKLAVGEEFPENATVGEIEPCDPVEEVEST